MSNCLAQLLLINAWGVLDRPSGMGEDSCLSQQSGLPSRHPVSWDRMPGLCHPILCLSDDLGLLTLHATCPCDQTIGTLRQLHPARMALQHLLHSNWVDDGPSAVGQDQAGTKYPIHLPKRGHVAVSPIQ